MKKELEKSVQAALSAQVKKDETLVTPVPCQTQVKSSHKIGEEAEEVSITVDKTCAGVIYSTQALTDLVTPHMTQEAIKQLGSGYSLLGKVTTQTIKRTMKQGTIELDMKASGVFVYQFDQRELKQLKQQIAGKEKATAKETLLQARGIQSVSITTEHTNTIPIESRQIRLLVLSSF